MSTITAAAIAPEAGHTHEAMRLDAFRAYVSNIVWSEKKVRPSVCLYARYYSVEYLERAIRAGYPRPSRFPTTPRWTAFTLPPLVKVSTTSGTIVEPLKGTSTDAPAYNVPLYHAPFAGWPCSRSLWTDDPARGPRRHPHVSTDKSFYLEIYNTRIRADRRSC